MVQPGSWLEHSPGPLPLRVQRTFFFPTSSFSQPIGWTATARAVRKTKTIPPGLPAVPGIFFCRPAVDFPPFFSFGSFQSVDFSVCISLSAPNEFCLHGVVGVKVPENCLSRMICSLCGSFTPESEVVRPNPKVNAQWYACNLLPPTSPVGILSMPRPAGESTASSMRTSSAPSGSTGPILVVDCKILYFPNSGFFFEKNIMKGKYATKICSSQTTCMAGFL